MLDAEVVGDDVKARRSARPIAFAQIPRAGSPLVRRLAAHHFREIEPRHRRRCPCPRDGSLGVRVIRGAAGQDAAVLRALFAKEPRELPRIDVGDTHDLVLREVRVEAACRPEVRLDSRQIANDEACRESTSRFDVLGIDADIADVRIREGDDLARVARVGEDLLIPRHRRVEHDLAYRRALGTDRPSAEHRAVGKREYRGRDSGKERRAGRFDGIRGGHGEGVVGWQKCG